MKLLDQTFEILPDSLDNNYLKNIEIAGRVCYKSENLITEDSHKDFVKMLIRRKHLSPLEHGTIYLKFYRPYGYLKFYRPYGNYDRINFYKNNAYSKVFIDKDYAYVTTNYRVIKENNIEYDLEHIEKEDLTKYYRRISVKFTCSRAIANELVRHRVFSFCQESQRYCNYSLDKFSNEITFIKPEWLDTAHLTSVEAFLDSCQSAETLYFTLLKDLGKPQLAREVLTNAVKTEIVMTGFTEDWRNFFKLRCSPAAHPAMIKLAKNLKVKMLSQLHSNDMFKTII